MNNRRKREVLTVLFLCVLWYIISSSVNVVGKTILSEFSFPMTVTMVQLTSITAYSGPFFNLWGVRKNTSEISWGYFVRLIVPLAIGKFISTVFAHVSIWKVPVSYAHTVKATMPLFTVILSRLILNEKQTWKVYCSLLPIVGGVAVATLTELSFNIVGLISALASTLIVCLVSIYSKKVLRDTGIHHLRLLHIVVKAAAIMFLPICLFSDTSGLISYWHATSMDTKLRITALLFLDGFLNWLQNILAFSILSIVTPLTYAVASASKRIFVIAATLFILGNPVTGLNVVGMMMAIIGVLCYNKAKYDQIQVEKNTTLLPKLHVSNHNSHSNFMVNGWTTQTPKLFAV